MLTAKESLVARRSTSHRSALVAAKRSECRGLARGLGALWILVDLIDTGATSGSLFHHILEDLAFYKHNETF
jgi:hypothetical protein